MATILRYDTLASTQDVALERARRGEPSGTVVIARSQTAGRGRLDRRWASPPGGLYASVIVDPPANGQALLSVAIGTVLSRRFESDYGVPTEIKWPNDLLVVRRGWPPRKLAGILVDGFDDGAGRRRYVVGIGVNVSTRRDDFPSELQGRAVSIAELVGSAPELGRVERSVIESVDEAWRTLDGGGSAALLADLAERLYGRGRPVRLDGRPAGVLRAISADGALVLESRGRTEEVRAGEITVEEDGR